MNPGTLLIVDDDERLLLAMKRALRKEGYKLLFARNGEEGFKRLLKNPVDIVISDYQMPGINGLKFLQKVKEQFPDILTIMMTGIEDIQVAVEAINEAGVYKFILKPWGSADLKITIKRAIETLELLRERDALLEKIKARDALLKKLEREHPGITSVRRDKDGAIVW